VFDVREKALETRSDPLSAAIERSIAGVLDPQYPATGRTITAADPHPTLIGIKGKPALWPEFRAYYCDDAGAWRDTENDSIWPGGRPCEPWPIPQSGTT
jgi:hypothetical protein